MCPIPYKVLLPETPGARTKGWGEDRTGPLVWGARRRAGQVPLFLPPLLLLLSPLLPPFLFSPPSFPSSFFSFSPSSSPLVDSY